MHDGTLKVDVQLPYSRNEKWEKAMKSLMAVAIISAMATTVSAADHQVKMVNKDSEGRVMQFEPAYLKVAPGDTVTFVATDKGHNSESVLGMIPEGAKTWKGKINQEVTVTFDVEGLYGYKCTPHLAMGMVGLVEVGDAAANLDQVAAVKLPGKAKARMEELLTQATSE